MNNTAELIATANKCLEAGISVMPLSGKVPVLVEWNPLQSNRLTGNMIVGFYEGKLVTPGETPDPLQDLEIIKSRPITGLGLIMGAISGNLEAIDVDCKNDPDGTLWQHLNAAISYDDRVSGIFKEIVKAKTVGGGYHLIYRHTAINSKTSKPPGSTVLAKTPDKKPLIETRGEGGYIAAYPTPGYEIIEGDLSDIPTITHEEREALFSICRGFTLIQDAPVSSPQPQRGVKSTTAGNRPGDDYDTRTSASDLADLLERHGWRIISARHHNRISVLRPGKDLDIRNETSGTITNVTGAVPLLSVWSTSAAPFEVDKPDGSKKAYTPFSCYAELEHKGDYKAAARALYAKGYGERMNPAKEIETPTGLTIYKQDHTTGERIVIAAPGAHLHANDLREMSGYRIVLDAPGIPDQQIRPAIDLIHASGKGCFVDDGSGELVFGYRVIVDCIISKYAGSEDEGLSDIEISNFIDEIAKAAGKMPRAESEMFVKDLTDHTGHLGISKQTIEAAAEVIRAVHEEKKLTDKTDEMWQKAIQEDNIFKRLQIISEQSWDLRRQAGTASLEEINRIITHDHLTEVFQKAPEDLATGYRVGLDGGKSFELNLPAAALSVIAGRTSHRKTGLCMNIALNVAMNASNKKDVYFFSYEESREVIFLKFLALYCNLALPGGDYLHLKNYFKTGGAANPDNKESLYHHPIQAFTRDIINTGKLRISEPNMSVTELSQATRQLKDNNNPGLIVVDYFQLLRHEEASKKTRQAELLDVCEELRRVAGNTRLPILLAAQFNREVKQEEDIESYHIRESGDIEQTTNLIIGIWDRNFSRESKAKPKKAAGGSNIADAAPLQRQRDGNPAKKEPGLLYAEILKGRDIGAGASTLLSYVPESGRISQGKIGISANDGIKKHEADKNKRQAIAPDPEPTPEAAPDDDDMPF